MIKKALQKRKNKNELTFVEHLEDLRWMLIRIIIAILAGAIIVFINLDFFFDEILMSPAKKDFISFKILCIIGKYIGLDKWCDIKYDVMFQSTKMAAQFMMSFTFSFVMGIIVAFPYIVFQVWKFIQPALVQQESLKIKWYVFSISLCFFVGVFFAYFVIAPYSFMFFSNYQLSTAIQNRFIISDYVSLMTQIVLGCGLIFQLPVLVVIITKMGLITPDILKNNRKYVIVIILILSAIITPPDFFSQIIVSIPLVLLMELSIWLSKYTYKRIAKV